MNEELFLERVKRVETATALKEPDRVPVCPFIASYAMRYGGSSYQDIFYDYEKAGEAVVSFYRDHPQMDITNFGAFSCGKANELAGIKVIDWPGRPGGKVDRYSSHQVIEMELMMPEEYPELLRDFTGFMLRKYLPRAYGNIKGTAGLNLTPTIVLSTGLFSSFGTEEAQETFRLFAEIAAEERKAAEASAKYRHQITDLGFPPIMVMGSEAPYDILGDYFRGTMGIFEDLHDPDLQDYVEKACWMFADMQIERLRALCNPDAPVRRVSFPLHKGMDGFMSPAQYERFYWKPLKKVMLSLIDMGMTPYLYTEGPYNTRLETLADMPAGKAIYHFENVDMKRAKEILGGIACICGNLSLSHLEFGTREKVVDDTKRLLDTCAPGGGYLFDLSGCLENAKPENLEAMFETLEIYGKY